MFVSEGHLDRRIVILVKFPVIVTFFLCVQSPNVYLFYFLSTDDKFKKKKKM